MTVTTNGALTQSGPLTVAGTTTLIAGAGNDITLTDASNNFSTVAVTSGRNVAVTDASALDLGASTISGTLNVTNGASTDSGNVVVTGATTLAAGAANDIMLDSAGNNFSTVAVNSGNNVTLTDATALDLGASTISGTLDVVANGLISQSGALTVGGSASFDTTAATALGSVSLTNSGALTLGTSTIGGPLALATTAGDLTLAPGQTLTAAGDANLTAAGSVNLLGATQIGGTQTLHSGTGSTFALASDTNLNALPLPSSGNITVNLTGTQATFAGAPILPSAVNLSNTGNNFGGTVSVTTASPAFTGSVTNTHNLAQTSPVSLNPGQALTVTDAGGTAGKRGNITLDNAGNNFNSVNFAGGDIAWQQANAISIGSASANLGTTSSGALIITANGPITQTGPVTAVGTTTLNATGGNITLTHVANDFNTVSVSSGNDVTLVDANSLNLAASAVTGNLTVTTNGPLTQNGPLIVAVSAILAAGGNNITLDNSANDFSTVAVTSGNNVVLSDANALNLGASTVSGALNVTTGGPIGQSGALSVSGATTLSAGSSDITLNNPANNFSTLAISSGNNVTLADATTLDLGASTVSGNLNVTTNGALTQSGPLTVVGTTTLAAGAGNDIALSNPANNFSTVAVTTGNNVALSDTNGLNLGASAVSGTLNVTTGGTVTQSGPLAVTGATTLAAGSGNDITLDSAGNNFSTVGVTSGRNVTLADANALDLGASTVSGTLNVTTNGALTQSGALNVTGATTLSGGTANDITLNNASNNFSTVTVTSGNNVTLVDNNTLNLGSSAISGALNVTTNGALTQSGSVAVAGTATFTAGSANDITLNSAGNNFSTVAITTGNNVTLQDANALDLGTSTVSGNLNVTTNGGLTQSGPVVVAGATTLAAGAGNITLDNAANNFSSLEVTSANNLTLQDSNNISLGTSTVAGNFSVTAGGAILDGDASTINIIAATANLIAASNIGTAVDPLETNVGTLNVSTTSGGIFVNEVNAVTLANISAGGGHDIAISNTSGNMTVNLVTTAGGAVMLASPGGAIQDGNGAVNNVTAGTLAVSAANGIDLDTTITTLSSASVTGTGSIDISNTGALAANNVTTANGNIALNATGGNLAIITVTAAGAGNVTLSTTTTGDITLGSVTSPNTMTITSAGGITDTNGAAANISTNTANLTASANIGTLGDPIETTVGTLNATATAGGISITEADAVTLNNIGAGGGDVTISNTTGDMTINSITAKAGGINLTASVGSILDGNGAANNLTAVTDSNLRALGGVIGLNTDPIEVNINSGLLGVTATGQVGGISVHINGTVLPTNALTLLNSPPGEVIFNSRVLNPSPANLPNLIGIAAELNPQRVNEDDYFTELLLDVLGDDFVKAQPFYCKLDDSLRVKLDSNLCTEDDR